MLLDSHLLSGLSVLRSPLGRGHMSAKDSDYAFSSVVTELESNAIHQHTECWGILIVLAQSKLPPTCSSHLPPLPGIGKDEVRGFETLREIGI